MYKTWPMLITKLVIPPPAEGRYIASGHNTDFLEMGMQLLPKNGENFPIPKKPLPKWLLILVGPMVNKLFTRNYIKNNTNVEWRADNSKIQRELKVSFRPLRESMEDGFQALIDNGILKAK